MVFPVAFRACVTPHGRRTSLEEFCMSRFTSVLAALALALPTLAQAASVTVTIEDPGVMSANLAGIGATDAIVESFDSAPKGNLKSYQSVLGTYSGGKVKNRDVFGGADETPYLYVQGTPGATLSLNVAARYVGFWWSAGSGRNQVELLSGGNSLFSFNTDDVTAFIKTNAADPDAYYGNPNAKYRGMVSHEPFAFINLFSTQAFDTVVFSGGNFESDNHTLASKYDQLSGTNLAPIPLPASVSFLLAGLGAMALVARRRRRA
jgi:hypothetical protein